MIIYLDESKKLGEGKIVFGGFITKHNTQYINTFVKRKKEEYGFKNSDIELKGCDSSGSVFYNRMIKDTNFDIISSNIIGVNVSGYHKDGVDDYIKIILEIIGKIYNGIKYYNKDIKIIADKVNLSNKLSKVEREIEKQLNEKYRIKGKYKFNFGDSKTFGGVQIADIIAYELRLVNINKEKCLDEFFLENIYNIDVEEVFEI